MSCVKSVDVANDTYYDSVRAILLSALEIVQAKYGGVSLISSEIGGLQSYISHWSPSSLRAGISVAHWVVTHRQPLALENLEQALLVPDLLINKRKALPLICVPIEVNGITLGALQSSFPPVAGQEELQGKQHLLKLAADLIGYVIENATLWRQLQETKEPLRKVNNISLEIQEREREHLILEVNDGTVQTLDSAFQYLQTVNNIGGLRQEYSKQFFARAAGLIKQATQETREVINSITIATLDILGLVTTVRQELKQFEKETGRQVDLWLTTWPNFPKPMEFAIYKIIREAVPNVRKHAKSPKLEVELGQEQKWLVRKAKDHSVGFIPDKQELSSSNRCLGLFGMRRHAEFLGGIFKIDSSSGKGTEILVEIPWSSSRG